VDDDDHLAVVKVDLELLPDARGQIP